MRQRPPPRRRSPAPEADATSVVHPAVEPVTIDPAALLRQHLGASLATGSQQPAEHAGTPADSAVDQPWRTRLSEIGEEAGLTGDQEQEFERLARDQVERIRTEIPRLLEELKPHFDTPGEADAKQRYESGLRALKAQLDEETDAVLRRFGLSPDVDSPV